MMQEKYLAYQNISIYYRIVGKGESVMLVHGFGEDGDIWQNQVNFLKDHFRLIIPDLPGSGKSEMITDMSIEGMAEVLQAIIQSESVEATQKITMLGHSMGGYITMAFAEKHHEELSAFGLVHSSAFADSEEKKAGRKKSIEFVKKNGAYEFLKTAIPGLFTEEWKAKHTSVVEALVEKSRNFSDKAIIAYYQSMINRPDRTVTLKNSDIPVLFIMGEHDKAVPFQQSLQQCYLPNQSHVHILRESAHMGMWEEHGLINQHLLKFLQLIINRQTAN